jgi:hypothetical protein
MGDQTQVIMKALLNSLSLRRFGLFLRGFLRQISQLPTSVLLPLKFREFVMQVPVSQTQTPWKTMPPQQQGNQNHLVAQ